MYPLTRRSTRATRLSNNRSRRFISIRQLKRATLLGLTLFTAGMVNQIFAQSSVFTYQGRLEDGGAAANGSYDFRFTLWDASSGGTQQPQPGPVTVNLSNVQVTAGNFSVQLDFGATAFPGADRYLEMSVQLAGVGPFTTLSPRTKVTGTPYAIRSVSAANADTVTDGSITSAKLASNLTLTGTTTGTFSGPLTGNVTGNTSGSAASFTGSLVGDVTGTQGATVVSTVGAVTAANVASGANLANAATDANTVSTIVRRDGSGSFSAGTITAVGDMNLSTTNTAGTVGVINQNGFPLIHSFGSNNFFAGKNAGNFTLTGLNNTASGVNALFSNTNGNFNTASGMNALQFNTTGFDNTASGFQALQFNTIGFSNTASGVSALQNNTIGASNTASGEVALFSNTTGKNNTASGNGALQSNTTGGKNIGLGFLAGANLTTGNNNIDIGNTGVAGESNIIRIGAGQTDTFLTGIIHGDGSGLTNLSAATSFTGSLVGDVTGTQGATVVSTVGAVTAANVASGANLANAATNANAAGTIVRRDGSGNFAAQTITAGGDVNLSTTNAAGTVGVINQNGNPLIHSFGTNNFFAGRSAGNFTLTGVNNTASGSFALQFNTTGFQNTASGTGALGSNTTGGQNTASGTGALGSNTTGVDNTASGFGALQSNTTGNSNTASGTNALLFNTTGDRNIGLGSSAGTNVTTGSNNIDIGNSGVAADSSIIRIGTSGTQTKAFVAGISGVTTDVNDAVPVVVSATNGQLGTISSSRRYKQDIKDMGSTSSRLMVLRPVTFRYLKPYANGEKPMQFGLIAEEVAETFPELVVRNKEGQPETVKYQDLTPLLLNEVQKQAREVQKQAREVQKQAKTIAGLQAQATNVANGITTTGEQGEGTVTLPDRFVALNQDFRYQLTVVGQFAQAIVLQEVKGNQFKIKTDKPKVKVSWQVTGIRHDQSAGNQK